MKKNIMIIVCFLVLAGLIFGGLTLRNKDAEQPTVYETPQTAQTPEAAPAPALQQPEESVELKPQVTKKKTKSGSATIQGSLTFPGSAIPETLRGCARNVKTSKQYCAKKQAKSSEFVYDLGYKITVPAGSYTVFVVGGPQGEPAYHNTYMQSFVRNDSWPIYPDCSQVKPVTVTVKAGEVTEDIALGDWYYEAKCSS